MTLMPGAAEYTASVGAEDSSAAHEEQSVFGQRSN